MSYLALARRYRPDDFTKILAQNHITRTLANAISTGRISHAYLFCGPRGTGKTSTARVLAKSLNCAQGPTLSPCGECTSCKEIKAGMSPDVFEIDAASNRGIDDIRELRENVRYAPVAGRYKIYIIDEVHRLTNEAFDALLKTLEEPPPHVIFMFATTEPHNLPATILSRTQRFDFKRVPVNALAETVTNVAKDEGLEIEPKAAILIGRKADGSLRDALSLLDQLISFSEGSITMQSATEILGLVKAEFLFDITDAIFKHDTQAALNMFNIYFNEGSDIEQLADELLSFISKLLMIKNGIRETSLLEMDSKEIDKADTLIETVDTADLLRMMNILSEFNSNKKAGVDPVVAIEIALTSLAGLDKTVDIGQLLSGMGGPSNSSSKASPKPQSPAYKPQPPRQTGFSAQAATRPTSRPSPPPQAPPPSQEHEPPTGPHKLAEIDKWWDNFLSFIRAKRPGLWSQLNQLKLNGAEGNSVIMGYDDNTQQLKNFLAKDKSSIIEYLTEFCGNETTISFVKAKMENGQMNGTNGNSLDSARQFLNNHPLIKQVIDNVDGDVIGFRGSV
jgi:DNA polymerase-3 subunit gamma/tau